MAKHPYRAPRVVSRAKCLVDGCDRLEELANGRSAGGLCAGHRKRKKLQRPIEGPLNESKAHRRTPRQMVLDAVQRVADADATEDDEYDRAVEELFRTIRRYRKRTKNGAGPSTRPL